MTTIAILGAGSWGTALAITVARGGHDVRLWARDAALAARVERTRTNDLHLPGHRLPANVAIDTDAQRVAADARALLVVVPAQSVASVLEPFRQSRLPVIVCAKGFEQETGRLMSEVAAAACPQAPILALSGPSFAAEVARGLPTAVTLAASDLARAQQLASLLSVPTFRIYPSDDLTGVEIGGALKNVIAIAAGALIGKELGENARAALVTRGLAEIGRLAEALGGRRETLMGLSGMGDLLLTATSLTSRNTRFGYELAQGRSAQTFKERGRPLVEGAWSAKAALIAARRAGVDLPITAAVSDVIEGRTNIDEAIRHLLARPLPAREI